MGAHFMSFGPCKQLLTWSGVWPSRCSLVDAPESDSGFAGIRNPGEARAWLCHYIEECFPVSVRLLLGWWLHGQAVDWRRLCSAEDVVDGAVFVAN